MHAMTGTSWTLTLDGPATTPSFGAGAGILHASSLVGREQELAATADRVRRLGLVTVTGTTGVGKSALALRVAQKLAPLFRGGYRAIDAARAADCEHLRAMVAAAIRPARTAQAPAPAGAGEMAGLLLLMDNCDRHRACMPGLVRMLRSARPDVHVVITARLLDVGGGASLALQPLPYPEDAGLTGPEALRFPAVRLFVQETARHVPAFVLTDDITEPAVEVCQRAGGVPLAIKLAAAWVPHVALPWLPALMGPDVIHRLGAGNAAAPSSGTEPANAAADHSHRVAPAGRLPRFAPRGYRAAARRDLRH